MPEMHFKTVFFNFNLYTLKTNSSAKSVMAFILYISLEMPRNAELLEALLHRDNR